MKTWTVYFELFGKKMKTDVQADSPYAAQCKVKDKIIFHRTIESQSQTPKNEEDVFNSIRDIFGMK
jgi:hypothetical protein